MIYSQRTIIYLNSLKLNWVKTY